MCSVIESWFNLEPQVIFVLAEEYPTNCMVIAISLPLNNMLKILVGGLLRKMGMVQLEQIIQRDDVPSDVKQIIREILLEYSQEQIRQKGEQFKNTIDSLNHPFYVVDASNYQIKEINTTGKQLYGGYEDGITCFALTHRISKPCSFKGESCPIGEIKRTKKPVVLEHQHYDTMGNVRVMEIHGHPIFDDDGNVTQVIEYSLDITERKRMEDELNRAKKRLEYLLISNPAVIYSCEPKDNFQTTFMSENIINVLGFESQNFLSSHNFWIERLHPEDRERAVIQFTEIDEKGSYSDVYRFRHKDETYHWMLEEAKLVCDDYGNPIEVVGYWTDITELKQAEEALRESEERLRSFMEASPDSFLLLNDDLNLIEINRVSLSRFPAGIKKEEIIGKNISELSPIVKTRTIDLYEQYQKVLKTGEPFELEEFIPRPKSGEKTFSLKAFKVGEGLGIIVTDITERKHIEKAMNDRLAIEQLMSNVSRNFINLPLEEMDKGINDALKSITEHAGAVRSSLFIYSEDLQTVTNTHEWCKDPEDSQITLLQNIPSITFGYYWEILKQKKNVVISYKTDLPPEAEGEWRWIKEHGWRSLLFVPMVLEGQIYGTLGFYSKLGEEKQWSNDLVTLIEYVTQIIANTIERQKAEQALRASEERLRAFLDSDIDAIELFDSKLNLVECNQAVIDEFPDVTKKENLIGKNIIDLVPDIKETGRYDKYLEVIRTGNPFFLDSYTSHPKFGDKYYSVKAFKVGNGIGMVNRDITDQKNAEIALQESEKRLRDLIDSATDSITLWDSNLNLIDYNSAMLTMLPEGTKKDDIIGKNLADFDPKMKERKQYSQFLEVIKIGESLTLEGSFSYTKQSGLDLLVNVFKVGDGLGIITTDITKRKQMEKALRESEIKYRSLVERAKDGIAIVQEYKLVFLNQQFARMLGYTVEEMLNLPYQHITHPEVTSEIDKQYEARIDGEDPISIYETTLMKKDGSSIDVEFNVGVITYQGKIATLTFVRDITERKKLEKARHDLDNRRSAFVSMTSHELRTPITVIKGYTEFLDKNFEKIDVIRKSQAIQSISRNLIRLERLIEGVADITRMEQGIFQLNLEVIDFFKFLKTSLLPYNELYENKFSIHGTLEFQSPVFLKIDPDRIRQVLDNLTDNANKHTPESGKIVLSTVLLPRSVQILVTDSGDGIKSSDLERIFDQFVSITTQYTTGGTGIGLYISKIICEAHGGTLTAHSEGKNKGATFTVELSRWFEK